MVASTKSQNSRGAAYFSTMLVSLQGPWLARKFHLTLRVRSHHVSPHPRFAGEVRPIRCLRLFTPRNGPASKHRGTSRIPSPATSHPGTQRRERPEPLCNFSPSTFPLPAISFPANPPATTSPRSMRSRTLANTFFFGFTAIDGAPLKDLYWQIPG